MRALDVVQQSLTRLSEQRSQTIDAMESIAQAAIRGGRNLTPDETRDVDELQRSIEELDSELATLEAREAELSNGAERTARIAERPALHSVTARSGNPWERARSTTDRTELRALARGAIEQTDAAPAKSRERLTRQLEEPERDDDAVSRWVLASSDRNYRSAFEKVVADPTSARVQMTDTELAAVAHANDAKRSLNLGANAEGLYLMPFELDASILLSGDGAISSIEDYASVKMIATKTWHGISSAGVTSSWDDELEEVSDDAPTDLAQPSISVERLSTFVPWSIEAGADVPDLVEEMARVVRDDQDVKLATAYWTGSGNGEPTGVVTALDANTNSEVTLTTAGTFDLSQVYRLHEAVPPRFRGNATWAANVSIINLVRRMGETVTGNAATIVDSLQAGNPPQLLGRPFIEASPMDSTVDTDTSFLVFGDLSRYVIPKRPSTVEVVPHLFGTTNGRPIGARGLLAFTRVGGDVVTDEAMRLLINN